MCDFRFLSSCGDVDVGRKVALTLDNTASLTIVMWVVFLGDTAHGIFFPTLWTYVKTMGGNRITLGYTVGAFSLGRLVHCLLLLLYFDTLFNISLTASVYKHKRIVTVACLFAYRAG